MDFIRYSSIENSYRKKFLDKIVEEGWGRLHYYVTEKIHGSNFSFWTNGIDTTAAKRSEFIKEGEKFFNYNRVFNDYKDNISQLFNYLKSQDESVQQVTVFGELFGGYYPNMPQTETCVQKGIYYKDTEDFIVFDIKVNGVYLDLTEVISKCKQFDIPCIEILFQGSLEKCLEYPNAFQTTIPAKFGLPDIEGNICEGVVIRPNKTHYLWDRSRLIIKNKNEKFTEKKNVVKKPKKEVIYSANLSEMLEKADQYITENRLRNVLSHVGEVTKNDFGKIIGSFTSDIMLDLIKDEQELFDKLEKNERKVVGKKVGQSAAKLLRDNFINIVDGEF